MSPEQYTDYLHRSIPLTAAMAVQVLRLDAECVEIRAPLPPNRNHHGTAFGGSLSTLAILSGWTLVQRGLDTARIAAKLMVQRSESDFLAPAEAEFVAESRFASEAEWPRFAEQLNHRGRARIAVDIRILARERVAMRTQAIYAALRSEA